MAYWHCLSHFFVRTWMDLVHANFFHERKKLTELRNFCDAESFHPQSTCIATEQRRTDCCLCNLCNSPWSDNLKSTSSHMIKKTLTKYVWVICWGPCFFPWNHALQWLAIQHLTNHAIHRKECLKDWISRISYVMYVYLSKSMCVCVYYINIYIRTETERERERARERCK